VKRNKVRLFELSRTESYPEDCGKMWKTLWIVHNSVKVKINSVENL